jgi:hypothetical protein
VVQSVRLPAEAFAAIEEIAAWAGVPVSALIRGWVRHPYCRALLARSPSYRLYTWSRVDS